MIWLLAILLLVALVFLPGWWVQRVMQRYSEPGNRYQGSGGELARHLLDRLGLQDVAVEPTDQGDHYDLQKRAVRLTPDKLAGRSLTAITVAAHEVGHAHQHATGYAPLAWRARLVGLAAPAERLGAGLLMLTPLIAVALRAPRLAFVALLVGVLTMLLTTIVHLVTLPVELDASFGRAMPMLEKGGYLKPGDEPHARRLLRAAAWTYFSASLMSLLNMARWWAILRR